MHSTGVEELDARANRLLPAIAFDGLQGEAHAVLPSSSSDVPTTTGISDLAISQPSLSGPSFAIEETVNVIESSTGNPIAPVTNVASVTASAGAENIKGKAQALVLTGLCAVVFVYAAKLPIVDPMEIQSLPRLHLCWVPPMIPRLSQLNRPRGCFAACHRRC